LVGKAKLLISPDTSLIHFAAAFDTSVISLTTNAPANQIKFAPLSSNNIVIAPINDIDVSYIEVEQVVSAYLEMQAKLFPL